MEERNEQTPSPSASDDGHFSSSLRSNEEGDRDVSPASAGKKHRGDDVGTAAIPKRRQNRIAAMQFLYAWSLSSIHGEVSDELREFFEKASAEKDEKPEFAFADVSELGHEREFYSFAEELIVGTLENLQRIDSEISAAAQNWSLDRIARCDLAILRLAIYELLFRTDIPPVVSINEAIDLAKAYSTEDSHKFVNGILDTVKKTLSRPLRRPQK